MLKGLNSQIATLDERKQALDADWGDPGHHTLLDFYVRIMPRAAGAERCSIFIHDPLKQSAWLKAGTGVAEKEIELSLQSDSIVGRVMESGEAVIVRDLDKVEGEHRRTDQTTGFVTREILCVPIKSLDGKEVTGAVQLLNKLGGESFAEEDQQLLEEMVHYLQWSMENIYFHTQATETVKSVFQVMSTVLTFGLLAVLVIGAGLFVMM